MTPPAGPSGGVTVIVIPQPTVNGPLHIGHLSGPYLAADVASRAARSRGERVLTLAGVDIHPNYVLTKAESLDADVDELIATYKGQIMTAFERARIGYDVFLDPQEPTYQKAIAGMLGELVDSGTVPVQEMTLHQCADCGRTLHHSYVVGKCPVCGTGANGTSCEGCGGFTSAQVLLDPSCARCGGPPRPVVLDVPVLRLEDYRDRLTTEWLQAEWPRRVRSVLRQYRNAPLPDVPLAYPTNWGIECGGPLDGMRVDFPTELGLSYLYGPAQALRPEAASLAERVAAWSEVDGVWHFNGMDNTFYFTVLYPAILAAAGRPDPDPAAGARRGRDPAGGAGPAPDRLRRGAGGARPAGGAEHGDRRRLGGAGGAHRSRPLVAGREPVAPGARLHRRRRTGREPAGLAAGRGGRADRGVGRRAGARRPRPGRPG